jgi:hypothetical protein
MVDPFDGSMVEPQETLIRQNGNKVLSVRQGVSMVMYNGLCKKAGIENDYTKFISTIFDGDNVMSGIR